MQLSTIITSVFAALNLVSANSNLECSKFSNLANVFASETVPAPHVGKGQVTYVPWNLTDSTDWVIDSRNPTKLINVNPGVWSVIAQLQLSSNRRLLENLNGKTAVLIDGFFRLNKEKVAASDATSSVSLLNPKNVLAIALTLKFKKGDVLNLGVASTNPLLGFCAGSVNDGSKDENGNETNNTGVYAPSVIFTMSKLS